MIKASNFRVRDLLNSKNKLENLPIQNELNHLNDHSSKQDEAKFSTLLKSFENFITSLVNSHQKNYQIPKNAPSASSHPKQVDYRDRFVFVEVPDAINSKIDFKKLQVWTGEVCSQTLSIAFHYLMEKKLNYDQMKAFGSQNFLRNLIHLAESYTISPQEIKFIDYTIKEKIFPYLKTKYPLTVEKQINKSLSKAIKSIDNSQLPTNDYFFTSEIQFQFRENGRYDDIIMLFLNQIMTKIDKKQIDSDVTNYRHFKKIMKEIFDKSYNQHWMETGETAPIQIDEKARKDKQKYEEMTKSYISYLIGRKISQNTQIYSEQEIKSKSLSIKSPSILRIMTKWCEEFWNKIDDENYFLK